MIDGENFRLYRQACRRGEVHTKQRILAEFSSSKQGLIRGFERLELSHPELRDALDEVTPYKGLWANFSVGSLGRLRHLGMPEVCHLFSRGHRGN